MNCWEFKKCGREPGGSQVDKLGVCPASTCKAANGLHHGRNAGRCCWVVAGTYCNSDIQGTFAVKILNCMECDFYKLVTKEEDKFLTGKELLEKIEKEKQKMSK